MKLNEKNFETHKNEEQNEKIQKNSEQVGIIIKPETEKQIQVS